VQLSFGFHLVVYDRTRILWTDDVNDLLTGALGIGGEPEVLSAKIEQDTVLTDRVRNADLPDYTAEGDVEVTANLTIEPGVVIAFPEDATLIIDTSGAIIAQGESGDPVRFTSTDPGNGIKWAGIRIESSSTANELSYAIVEHAGGYDNHYLSGWKYVSVSVYPDAKLKLSNTVISNSDEHGLWSEGELSVFSENTFSDNLGIAAVINPNDWGVVDSSTTVTGNGTNAILIDGTEDLATAQTVTPLADDVPYLVYGELTVNAALTVQAGTLVQFDAKQEFAGDYGMLIISASGSLNAIGTAADPVVFTSSDIANGRHWTGIRFDDNSNSTANVLDHAEVSYGGVYNNHYVSGWRYANIGLEAGSRLELTDSTISNAEAPGGETGYGIVVHSTATLVESGNTFTGNEGDTLFP